MRYRRHRGRGRFRSRFHRGRGRYHPRAHRRRRHGVRRLRIGYRM